MNKFAIDQAAWASQWRAHAVVDKAVVFCGFVVASISVPVLGVVVIAAAVAVCAVLARVPGGLFARAMAIPLTFVVIGALTIGVQLAWPFVTAEGLRAGTTVFIRSLTGTAAMVLFACTTPMVDVITGLRRWRMPAPLVDVVSLMYRMVFLLADTAGRMREAQASRLGYATGKAARHSVGLLAAGLLRRSWERASALQEGLAGRNYTDDMVVLTDRRPSSPLFVGAGIAAIALAVAVGLLLRGWL